MSAKPKPAQEPNPDDTILEPIPYTGVVFIVNGVKVDPNGFPIEPVADAE